MAEGTQGQGPEGQTSEAEQISRGPEPPRDLRQHLPGWTGGQKPVGQQEAQPLAPSAPDVSVVQQTTQQSVRTPEQVAPAFRQPSAITEQILKIPTQDRIKFVTALPPDKQLEAMRVLKLTVEGGSTPDWLTVNQKSEFQGTLEMFELCSGYSPANYAKLDVQQQQDFDKLLNDSRDKIQSMVQEAEQARILVDVRTRALEFYKQLKVTKRHEKWGRDKQQVIDSARGGYGYKEFFWENSPQLKKLESKFRGVAQYIWDGIVSEADKEVNHEESPSLNVVAAEEFQRIREQRRIQRLSEKKYATHEYYGSRNWELTAESAEELVPSVLDWVRDQLAELSDTDVGSTHNQLNEIRTRGVQLLETCRVRLESEEGQKIPETHPDFLRAKATVESVTDSVGYEKVIYKGGEDISAQYAERFASNYIGHHDAIYLMPRIAYILLKLRTHKKGTYWMGHDFSEEKVDEGPIRKYRETIQEEIVEDAATHDIFISEKDFYKRNHADKDVNPEGRDLRYSFDDNIERLLLDPDGSVGVNIKEKLTKQGVSQEEIAKALERHSIRVKAFWDIKTRLDAKEEKGGWVGYTKEERKNAVRQKIIEQMRKKTDNSYLAGVTEEAMAKMEVARQSGRVDTFDQVMWKWVEDYNDYRIKFQLHKWYPSNWDRVRIKIDRPEKVIDRFLTDEQLGAMYERVRSLKESNLEDYQIAHAIDESRFGFQLARSYAILEMEDVLLGGIRARVRDPKNGEPVDPKNKVVRVFDVVQERLEDAITKEEAELKGIKDTAQAEIKRLKAQGKLEDAKAEQEKLDKRILGAQFLATHALKAMGFVDGKLPVWSQQLKDDSTINFFGNALAAYGVNVAYGEPISHNSKRELYEILERGRRALQVEYDRAAQKFMEGKYPVLPRDEYGNLVRKLDSGGEPIPAEAYMPDDYGETATIKEKNRIVNAGAVREHRAITDTRFETSTSGGVAVQELISEIGDMGFYPNLVRLGVVSIAGLHGYIKRRDEMEAHEQKLFTTMDPVFSARERAAAYKARKFLTGGNVSEGKSVPGFLNEPFHGAFKSADWLHEQYALAQSYGMDNTADYIAIMRHGYRPHRDDYKDYLGFKAEWSGEIPGIKNGTTINKKVTGEDVERLRQLSYLDFDKMSKPMADQFYTTMYGILDYFQDYLKALKPIQVSRGGRALRTWEETNHLKWYAFRRLMRESSAKDDKGFISKQGYSPEVASEIAIRMMEIALKDADYLILRSHEVKKRVKDGAEILSGVLTPEDKERGFEVEIKGEKTKTLAIPDEKYWYSLRPQIKAALETIRMRGLLEFMREEGYKIKLVDPKGELIKDKKGNTIYREVLGRNIPPLVQKERIKKDSRLIASF